MAKYHLTNKAVEDLSAIWNYTFDTWSEKQADTYYELLINGCDDIAKSPSLGRKYDEISEEIRGYKVGKHIIFYQILSKEDILIIRFLHEQMDLKKQNNRITQKKSMKKCPHCNAEVEENFDLCWNCNYDFKKGKIAEIADENWDKERNMSCLRCPGTKMQYAGNYKFHEGSRIGALGSFMEIFTNRESFDLYVCPKCGKVEFFSPAVRD